MAPITRNRSDRSIIDLTEDADDIDLAPPSPPRPTIANRVMQPRRRNRDGSASTSTGTVTSGSGSLSRGGSARPTTRASRTSSAINGNGNGNGNENGNADSSGTTTGGREDEEPTRTTRKRPTMVHRGSSSESSIVALEEGPEGMERVDLGKRRRLGKGKGRATSADLIDHIEFGGDSGRVLGVVQDDTEEEEGDGKVNGVPEEELLASFQCPICLAPPIQAVLTPCGHVTCGACLFSTLKTQAIRERRPPNAAGRLPTTGPGMKKPRGKADQEAWFRRYGADREGKIRGKILTGSCPVCRHDIEGGFGQPGEGGVVYLEVCTVSSVL